MTFVTIKRLTLFFLSIALSGVAHTQSLYTEQSFFKDQGINVPHTFAAGVRRISEDSYTANRTEVYFHLGKTDQYSGIYCGDLNKTLIEDHWYQLTTHGTHGPFGPGYCLAIDSIKELPNPLPPAPPGRQTFIIGVEHAIYLPNLYDYSLPDRGKCYHNPECKSDVTMDGLGLFLCGDQSGKLGLGHVYRIGVDKEHPTRKVPAMPTLSYGCLVVVSIEEVHLPGDTEGSDSDEKTKCYKAGNNPTPSGQVIAKSPACKPYF